MHHFKCGFTPFVVAVRVYKLTFIYVKNARAKTIIISLQMPIFLKSIHDNCDIHK